MAYHISRKLGDEPTRKNTKWYVVQTERNVWYANKDHIWGEGHKHRLMIEAKSGAEAIRKAKKQVRK